jgi:uncharacterized BrkB/YihY/UPF0761 family membrane protein
MTAAYPTQSHNRNAEALMVIDTLMPLLRRLLQGVVGHQAPKGLIPHVLTTCTFFHYVMSHFDMSHFVISCYVTLCYIMLCYVMLSHVRLRHIPPPPQERRGSM